MKVSLFDFDKLDVAIVQDWAVGTLQEWFDGYTEISDGVPVQYRVRLQDDGTYLLMPMTYSGDGYRERPTQRFAVKVEVTEVTE